MNEDDLTKKVEEARAEAGKKEEAPADDTTEHSAPPADSAPADETEELKNALARAMADLQNFKRRSEEEKMRFVKFANAELLSTLLPVIDNFNRSAEHLPEEMKNNDWAKGMVQIHDDFLKTLEKIGVKRMKTVGEKLDPKQHEALMEGEGKKDVIVEEFEPGYTYNEEVLKVAKVKVGKGS